MTATAASSGHSSAWFARSPGRLADLAVRSSPGRAAWPGAGLDAIRPAAPVRSRVFLPGRAEQLAGVIGVAHQPGQRRGAKPEDRAVRGGQAGPTRHPSRGPGSPVSRSCFAPLDCGFSGGQRAARYRNGSLAAGGVICPRPSASCVRVAVAIPPGGRRPMPATASPRHPGRQGRSPVGRLRPAR